MLYKIYLYLIDISSLHCLNTEIEQGIQAAKDFGSHRVCNPVPVEARGSRFVLCVIPCNTIDIEVVVDSIKIKQFKIIPGDVLVYQPWRRANETAWGRDEAF